MYGEDKKNVTSTTITKPFSVEHICKDTNLTEEKIMRSMQDRVEWRRIVKGCRVSLTR